MKKALEAIAERMIAAEDIGVTPSDLGVSDAIADYIGQLPPEIQKDIRRLVFLFEYLPPLLIFRPTRFSRLSRRHQDQYIEAWGTSRFGLLRTGFRVLKSLSVSVYYQNPRAWKAIGYER